ncbi:MAG TPA: pentapeptide repeat-containing protein [Azospirillum sp.]|nr:pentapeptide repeat-containing protein [Azospirillum sp.]
MGRLVTVATHLAVFAAVAVWLSEGGHRAEQADAARREAQYRALDLVHTVAGRKDDGGRLGALEDLAADGVSLERLPLAHAVLPGARLGGARLDGSTLSGAKLSSATLAGASLRGADLSAADLEGADLRNADLSGARLTGVRASGAVLAGADLARADLNGADLSGVDLRDTRGLTYRQLDGACGDSTTRLPVGLSVRPCTVAVGEAWTTTDRYGD